MSRRLKTITIKPHHFLDIMKLYGSGVRVFIPDSKYHHAFFSVGNSILENPNLLLKFVMGADDICTPCIFNRNGSCTDIHRGTSTSKEVYNKKIDKQLFHLLKITEGTLMSAKAFCELIHTQLNEKDVRKIWNEESDVILNQRVLHLDEGMRKYLCYFKLLNGFD